ncbi:MAG: ABC transporter ATP-binding protein [Candidatus Methanomethylophilaceae archaeon]|nr:ABC transporter ATP-binding protein [Candidatus Methanomethylophilaceae archaeon]
MTLKVEGVTCRYGGKEVLHGITFSSNAKIIAVVGPNAAGKSSLIKCIAGQMHHGGRVSFNGTEIGREEAASADMVGYMPQQHMNPVSMTVYEAILLGRLNHIRWSPSQNDRRIVDHAIHELSLDPIADKRINELSGGQMQMVSIAQALVKEPELLLMDEPTNNLDLQKQLEMFEVVRVLSEQRGLVTVMILHDLNMASRFADEIVVLSGGEVYAQGKPEEITTQEMLRDVYHIDADVVEDRDGLPHVIAYGSLDEGGKT